MENIVFFFWRFLSEVETSHFDMDLITLVSDAIMAHVKVEINMVVYLCRLT